MDNEEVALRGLKDVLDTKLEEERKNTKLPYLIVENWTNDTAIAMNDVLALKSAIYTKKEKSCFKTSRCPNCVWQYSLSKQADRLVGTLRNLKDKRNELPQELTYEADTPNIESILDEFMPSKSSKLALEEIISSLQTVNVIGLHGMPGVGKTTLAKKVIEEAKEERLFEECVMITVSQKPNTSHVQDRLADVLGVVFKETSSEQQNAGRLMSRIKDKKKKKLVVIDNLWEEINLIKIGIPPIRELENCKVLLTTRSVQVCIDLNCQRNIVLNPLTEDDEWALFTYAACLNDKEATYLAKQVARECCGLPLSIMSVGKSLIGKTGENAWKRALEKLKGGEIEDIQGINKEENPYRSIKYSFDELQEKDKRCLLLCGLFPLDYGIFIEKLTKYVEQLGLYHYYYSTSSEKVLSEIIERVEEFKYLNLLLRLDIEEEIKGVFRMHNLIRDVVLKIGKTSYLDVVDQSRKIVEGYLRKTSFTDIPNITIEANSLNRNLKNLSMNGNKWKLLCYLYAVDAGIFNDSDSISGIGEDEELCVMELGGYAYRMGMYLSFEDAMASLLGAIDEIKLNHLL